MFSMQVSDACRVRLYPTAALRTADLSRPRTTPPASRDVLLFEAIFTAAGTIPTVSAPLQNLDGSPADVIYASVTRDAAGTGTVTVTITGIPLEA